MFQEKRACNISEILSTLFYSKIRRLDENMGNVLFKEEKNTEVNEICSKCKFSVRAERGIC